MHSPGTYNICQTTTSFWIMGENNNNEHQIGTQDNKQ